MSFNKTFKWKGEAKDLPDLSKVDQASLWKQMITLVLGKSLKKRLGALHLLNKE